MKDENNSVNEYFADSGKSFETAKNASNISVDFLNQLYEQAGSGDAAAQYQLGTLYAAGLGAVLRKDPGKAAEWYRKAADQGYRKAEAQLAFMYWSGFGVAQDGAKSTYWTERAAEHGDPHCQFLMGAICSDGEYGVAKDDRKAAAWYRKAADQGDPQGLNALGGCYIRGDGVPQDLDKATELLRKAAELGHPQGMRRYGTILELGVGKEKKDLPKAIEWYEKAVKAGSTEAQKYLEKAREQLKEQQAAEERARKEASEKAEAERIRAMWDARDTSMETWTIIVSILSVAALIGEKYLMTHKLPFLLVLVEMVAVAASVIGVTAAAALFTGSFSEILAIPGGIAGFLAGLVAVILNGSADQ